MKEIIEYYSIKFEFSGFSDINTVCTEGNNVERSRKLIKTIDEAKLAIEHIKQVDPKYKGSDIEKYWEKVASTCKVVKVTTITEDVDIS